MKRNIYNKMKSFSALLFVTLIFLLLISGNSLFAGEISSIIAFYQWDAITNEHIFEIRGKANYPDNCWLYVALSYQGEKVDASRTVVKDRRFHVIFNTSRRVIPTYYDVEIVFFPNRQNNELIQLLQKLSEQKILVSLRVGDDQRIKKERERTIVLFQNILSRNKTFFDLLFNDFQKHITEKLKFDLKEWNAKYRENISDLNRAIDTLKTRQETFLAVLLGEYESIFKQYLIKSKQLYENITDMLISDKDTLGTLGIKKTSKSEVLTIFRNQFQSLHQSIESTLKLRDKLGDENFIIAQLRAIDILYQDLPVKYRQISDGAISAEIWEDFTRQFKQNAEKVKQELKDNLNEDLAKNFPEIYDMIISLPDSLNKLLELYLKTLDPKINKDVLKQTQEKIEEDKISFRRSFQNLVMNLGLQKSLPEKQLLKPEDQTAIIEIPAFASKEEETNYIETRIQKLKKTSDINTCAAIVREIIAAGQVSVTFLLDALPTINKNAAIAILRDLTAFKDEAKNITGNVIILLGKKIDDEVKIQIISLLCQIGNSSVIAPILKYAQQAEIKNNTVAVRTTVAGLGMMGLADNDAVEYLIGKLSDETPETRLLAYNSLIHILKTYQDFNSEANLSIRNQQVKAIKEWWERNKEKFQ